MNDADAETQKEANKAAFFVVYDPETGAILRVGTCPDDAVNLQAMNGEAVLRAPGPIDDLRYRVEGGALAEIPARPTEDHIFDPKAGAWVLDPATAARGEILAAMDYLRATDWYLARAVETGKPMPEDVKQKRAAARLVAERWKDFA